MVKYKQFGLTERKRLTIIYIPKKAPYLNPNERKVNQQIKSDVCANRFYEHMEEQKAAVSEYLALQLRDSDPKKLKLRDTHYGKTCNTVQVFGSLGKNTI
jgi:hypothetical protein